MIGMRALMRKRRRGVATVEWVILTPLMIVAFVFLLYVLFIALAYIQYNNLANVIAQDLNMRQSGYSGTPDVNPNISFTHDQTGIIVTGDGSGMDAFKQFLTGFKDDSVTTTMSVTGTSDEVIKVAKYSATKHKDRFYMPGVTVKNLDVRAVRNGAPATEFSNVSMSGTIIEVSIKYKIFGIEFEGTGYNIIS